MILRLLIPLAAMLASLGAAPPLPPMTAAEQAAASGVRAHVTYLADDRLEGRETGSRGYQLAADYVAAQFAAIGLKPGGPDGSWFEQVPFRRATNAHATVTLSGPGGARPLQWGRDAALRPSLVERHRAIDAPLVFVGYGLDEPLLGLTGYRGLHVRGKIVVALYGTPSRLPPDIAAHLRAAKAETALAHGAVGLIQVGDTLTDPATIATRPLVDWIGSPHLRAEIILSRQSQARLFDGAPRSLAELRAEARSSDPPGFDLPQRLSLTADSQWLDFSSPEVIARLPGTGRPDAPASEAILVMAHLDHLGIKPGARPGEHAIYNGALDNAAGVATMIEAARQLAANPVRPARSILFIANTGEEKGLLGADYFAAHPTLPAASIAGVVDLDMPLPLYDFTDVFPIGGDHSTLAATVAEAGRPMGIAIAPDPMPRESLFIRSDHYRFVEHGVPAILVMTGYANGGEAVWRDYLAHTYHSPRDTLSQPIEWRALGRFALLNARLARLLADAPERPRWIAGDYFGDRFAPGQTRALRSPG